MNKAYFRESNLCPLYILLKLCVNLVPICLNSIYGVAFRICNALKKDSCGCYSSGFLRYGQYSRVVCRGLPKKLQIQPIPFFVSA